MIRVTPKSGTPNLRSEPRISPYNKIGTLALPTVYLEAALVEEADRGKYTVGGKQYNSWYRLVTTGVTQVHFVGAELVDVQPIQDDWMVVDIPHYTFAGPREVIIAVVKHYQGFIDAIKTELKEQGVSDDELAL